MAVLGKHFLPLLALAAALSTADAAEPRLSRLVPQGVQRGGDEQVVKMTGARVDAEPQEVLLYRPGIEVTKVEAGEKNAALVTLKIAEDCPLGRHPIRLRTATGLSNLITLHVGTLPSLSEAEPNNAIEAPQKVELDTTVHGVVRRGDFDVFAIEPAEGERVSVEVEGLRLGHKLFDPAIDILNEQGEVIASNDDQTAAHADAFLSILAPSSDPLFVRLRDSANNGDDRCHYLLHIGRFPRPTAASLPIVARGEVATPWVGDAVGTFSQSVRVEPGSKSPVLVHAKDDRGVAPTPLPFWIADDAPTFEIEPNNKNQDATPAPCPGVAAGVIQEPGDNDRYRIKAKKGQALDLRVRARELRSPLDPVLRVYDSKGKRLAGNDDNRGHPDSYLRWKPPADGEYLLTIEDRLFRGDPAMGYVLDVSVPKPAADIKLDERRRYEATVIEVPRGGRTSAMLTVSRRDFGGELKTLIEGLPPGVTAECFPLAGNFNRVPVLFSATEEATPAAALAEVSVELTDSSNPRPVESRFRQQTWLVRGRNNVPVWSHFAERMPVAVTKELPFSIELVPPKAPLCQGGSMNLTVKATRAEGFDQSVRVYTLYHSPGMSSNRSRSITKGKLEATIPVTANGKARVGDWPMVVVGETNLAGRVYTATQFITLTVAEPYFDISVPTLTAFQGQSAEWTLKLSPRTPFEGAAKLELVGLPPGVSAAPVEIEAGADSVIFRLDIKGDARLGRNRGVGCRATLSVEGEPVVYRQGYAELRIDPPREQTAARDSDGGPST